MKSFNALQGAIALMSCLLDLPVNADCAADREALVAMVMRLISLQNGSPTCLEEYQTVRHLQWVSRCYDAVALQTL